ncbi:peroxisome biogenesis factor 2 [Harpegnathos saltator]|uniref:RING-type E3 ubiquitin transferase (cysteine targeting) n=1 Tax=Harpegnathos saltator TaxID=610380 RepID=E2B2C0_HARSA|nr:peroxisome biogenesis factor 2 [Harpegnathos saltator]XP_011153650.1 peroxisome biogenesis factor 2 [Harpegnathos saltator]XP_011153734.1 peroxisome biogenesis factor 2 [Harpegnathos saltator]XP_011153808.1 peroxisome biogenesis factor 2 [Harpegnathos saltator]XP_011153901.1 peroxisome biogenesis factor 2 [Harpegnathos saltator]EFN90157.1 Peroxisome assembly factor 1 [Harpegnathos saltator]
MPLPYVSRINQIDSAELDIEIYKLLKNEVNQIARYNAPGKFDKWQAEIDAILKILIWKFSLQQSNSTFGQRLLNLHYINLSQKKAILYLLLTVLPQYIKDKLANENLSAHGDNIHRLKSLVDRISNVISLLQLINLFFFLHRGIQSRLIELLLGLSTQSITTNKPRNIGYSYMTRELLWHSLMELFTIGLPMINFHYLKHLLRKLWRRRTIQQRDIKLLPVMDVSTKCAYCEENPILPSHAGCEHIFCYYCLKAHFTAMNTFHCPKCDVELYTGDMKRYMVATSTSNDTVLSLKGPT